MPRDLSKTTTLLPAVFDDFFKPWKDLFDSNGGRTWVATVPAVNIAEDKNIFSISMAAPGMQKDDFKIDLDGDVLTISAEKEESDETPSRQEYNYSSFSRSFTLPSTVIKDKIEAEYKHGELKLTLPKNEDAKKLAASKQIAIK